MKLLLSSLIEFVDSQEKNTFLYKEVEDEFGEVYILFNYRLVSFQDFQDNELAKFCRGTMFRKSDGSVVSRTPEKFFNYHEYGNFDYHVPLDKNWMPLTKHDGSLISTYLDSGGNIKLKSKYSLDSEQAIMAMEIFDEKEIRHDLSIYTYNYEFVSPQNIIVLPYSKPKLHLLSIINNVTGVYIWVNSNSNDFVNSNELEAWVNEVYTYDKELIEGYVMTSEDLGFRFKVKTNRYSSAHKLKDDVNSLKKLVGLVIEGDVDDMLLCQDIYHDNEFKNLLLARSELIKDKINDLYNEMEEFYNKYKDLSRKDYAIQLKLSSAPFGPTMNLYLEREDNLKEYIYKNLDLFEDIC